MRPRLNLTLLLSAAMLAGCATPDPSLYTLDRVAPHAAPAPAPTLALTVRRVSIPVYADRREIVRQVGAVTVQRDHLAHWAGPLDDMLTSVLAADLRARLPGAAITDATSPIAPAPGAEPVSVEITRMGMDERGAVVLVAEFAVGNSGRPHLARLQTTAADGSTAAYVAALNQTIGDLADRIEATVMAEPGSEDRD